MIVTLEGLSCAGKTTLINGLLRKAPGKYRSIPEFALPLPKEIDTEFCMRNDVFKSQSAKNLAKTTPVVLQDRSFISTIVYASVQAHDIQNMVSRFFEEQATTGFLTLPDVILYLSLPAGVAIKRAKKIGWYTDKYAWYTHTEQLVSEYESELDKYKGTGRVIVLEVNAAQNPKILLDKIDISLRELIKS